MVPCTAYCAWQQHIMLKTELRHMCKAGDAAQRLPEPQALMRGGMHVSRVHIDRNTKLVIWCTGHQWVHYKALADTADRVWLVLIADG